MSKRAHLCFVTPGHIASNPRLVKEAGAATGAGYRVSIVMSQYLAYLQVADQQILAGFPEWQVLNTDWVAANSPVRRLSGVRHALAKKVQPVFGNGFWADRAMSRLFDEQLRLAKKCKADLYIAHNLAALPVAAHAARLNQSRYAFDAEDYHRGQLENMEGPEFEAIRQTENQYIPEAAYLSAASPLIAKAYENHYPQHQVATINNVFSSAYQHPPAQADTREALSLYWFSQTVGPQRGLEDVLKAMGRLADKQITLTLLGSCNEKNRQYLSQLATDCGLAVDRIRFMDAVPPDEVFPISRQHDIGLALEIPHCLNRDICLTNKIFTYLIAGNAVIASQTQAQQQFMEAYPQVGHSFPTGDAEKLASILNHFYENRAALQACKQAAWELGHTELNWEKEQQVFLACVEKALS